MKLSSLSILYFLNQIHNDGVGQFDVKLLFFGDHDVGEREWKSIII